MSVCQCKHSTFQNNQSQLQQIQGCLTNTLTTILEMYPDSIRMNPGAIGSVTDWSGDFRNPWSVKSATAQWQLGWSLDDWSDHTVDQSSLNSQNNRWFVKRIRLKFVANSQKIGQTKGCIDRVQWWLWHHDWSSALILAHVNGPKPEFVTKIIWLKFLYEMSSFFWEYCD